VIESAPAKVNLCLYLGGTRERDGRHELVSVMQSVTLADDVTMEPGGAADEVVCPGVEGPNLALDALRAFREATGWDGPPQRVTIAKRVPVAAGMGGGSGDAAAVLRLAARAAGVEDDDLLRRIAAGLGADVPAQVRPGRVLATGAGEEVRMLAPAPPLGVLVLPARQGLSTADVYREADRLGLPRDNADLAARRAEVEAAPDAVPAVNDLQPAAISLAPAIERSLAVMRDVGADDAIVSGSGPTVVGLFRGDDGPERAWAVAAMLPGAHACEAVRA
jgi:4-diphosphocytidyl-2-C-methyl-D-erythritol kinase